MNSCSIIYTPPISHDPYNKLINCYTTMYSINFLSIYTYTQTDAHTLLTLPLNKSQNLLWLVEIIVVMRSLILLTHPSQFLFQLTQYMEYQAPIQYNVCINTMMPLMIIHGSPQQLHVPAKSCHILEGHKGEIL